MAVRKRERSPYGNVAELIEGGTDDAARALQQWISDFQQAVDGKRTAESIRAALRRAQRGIDTGKLERIIERRALHASMLGALEADIEARDGRATPDPRLTHERDRIVLGFTRDPLGRAIETFEEKGVVTREVFDHMTESAKRRSFTIAGQQSKGLLRSAQRELARQIRSGADLRDFRKFMAARFEAAGWTPKNPSHVETVFRTNVTQTYNQGRAEQQFQPAMRAARPFLRVVTVNDGPPRQRATHQAVHGLVARVDNPIWQTAYPPFGYNCRCRTVSMSKGYQGPVATGAEFSNLPDPGFSGGLGPLDVISVGLDEGIEAA